MKKLIYYPMIHIFDSTFFDQKEDYYFKKAVAEFSMLSSSEFKRLFEPAKIIFAERRKEIKHEWDKFVSYLETRDFDRIYMEGWKYPTSIKLRKYERPKELLSKCLGHFSKKGYVFEKTNSCLLEDISDLLDLGKNFRINQYLGEKVHSLRENYVCRRINKTLRDGETGLLLYGRGHMDELVKKLSALKLNFELYRHLDGTAPYSMTAKDEANLIATTMKQRYIEMKKS